MNNAQQTVEKFLQAVQTGDMQTVGALLHPALTWSQPGQNQFSGEKRNAQEVFAMVGGMFQVTVNTLKLETIQSISVNGQQVATVLHWTATLPTGEKLAVDNIDIYTVENGLITKVQVFTADAEQEDAFWGK
ncbi:hypothetical protein LX64_01223 [Chitinophaga skermanii]|uniref:SnoaL-like domain-containing protein n=1 Tax=Chitinophaga skermanii TaxID=331697 RepID=A0A327QW23_9BACT|nr:nuclear transport factor 2 family protein [Chitinophaga skermanii]RAJ08570.1 hypothetical protein LX64_01223 [Chitinophaga skermanii]